MMAGAPLILLGRPFALMVWGLPARARRWIGERVRPRTAIHGMYDLTTSPVAAWTISGGLLVAWHLPALYDAAETGAVLHDIEHLSFFLAGVLFWWPIIQSPPLSRPLALPACVGYLIAGMGLRAVLGGVITRAGRPLYEYYARLAALGIRAALEDQHLAGGIMWFGSGFLLLAAAILAVWRSPDSEVPGPAFSKGMIRRGAHGIIGTARG